MKYTFFLLILLITPKLHLLKAQNCYLESDKVFLLGDCKNERYYLKFDFGRQNYQLTNIDSVLFDSKLYSGNYPYSTSARLAYNYGLSFGLGPASLPVDFEFNFLFSSVVNNTIVDRKSSYDFNYEGDDNGVEYKMAFNSGYFSPGITLGIPLICNGKQIKRSLVIKPKFNIAYNIALKPNEIEYFSNGTVDISQQVRENLRLLMDIKSYFGLGAGVNFEYHFGERYFLSINYKHNFRNKNRDVLYVADNEFGIRDIGQPVGRINDNILSLSFGVCIFGK